MTDDRWKNALFFGLGRKGLAEMKVKLKRDAVKRCCNFWSNDIYVYIYIEIRAEWEEM